MNIPALENLNILSNQLLPTPLSIKAELPISEAAYVTVTSGRAAIENILSRRDKRLMLIIGPCAVHDVKAGVEYAERLKELVPKVADSFLLVMRVYFEKPRTTTGWKGLINDPFLDDSFRIDQGLNIGRKLMLDINEIGLPVGTEALDPIIPQYLSDLVSWTAIGARTTESQTHREMSSGLSTPVGFKNGTDGNVQVAVNAVKAASVSHRFLGINQFGQCSVFHTRGNALSHVVLRGGLKPNYDEASIKECELLMQKAAVPSSIVVDCSHGNSMKDPTRQSAVFDDVMAQIVKGNRSIVGLMLESNLKAGRQDLPADKSQLVYGQSITDACIDWTATEKLLLEAHEKLQASKVLAAR